MQQSAVQSRPLALPTLRWGAPVAEVLELVHRDGGVILEDALTEAEVAAINADMDAEIAALQAGSLKGDEMAQAFHGKRTKRLTNLVTISKTYRERLLDNDHTHDYVAAFFKGVCETFWLQSSQAIEIHPGERAQPLHRDMGNYPIFYRNGPEGPEVACNMILSLVHSTEQAGATRVIPGSHRWDFAEHGTAEETVPVEMQPGSVFFFGGKVVHGGGANTTSDVKRRVISSGFNPGFLVPEEAYPFTVPMEVARASSPRLQQMLGFRSFHQRNPAGGSLWQHNFEELALHLGL